MRIFISGPITGKRGYKSAFDKEEYNQQCKGNVVLNPAVLPKGLDEEAYAIRQGKIRIYPGGKTEWNR